MEAVMGKREYQKHESGENMTKSNSIQDDNDLYLKWEDIVNRLASAIEIGSFEDQEQIEIENYEYIWEFEDIQEAALSLLEEKSLGVLAGDPQGLVKFVDSEDPPILESSDHVRDWIDYTEDMED